MALLLRYLDAFRGRWLSLMSGGASVPFAIGAVFATNWQQILCIIASILFSFVAGFLVWQREHPRAEGYAERLTPKIEVSSPRILRATEHPPTRGVIHRHYIQLKVSPRTQAAVLDCRAHLTKVEKFLNMGVAVSYWFVDL